MNRGISVGAIFYNTNHMILFNYYSYSWFPPPAFKYVLIGVPLDYGVGEWVKEALYNVGTHS